MLLLGYDAQLFVKLPFVVFKKGYFWINSYLKLIEFEQQNVK